MRSCEIVSILEIMRMSEMGLSQRTIAASVNCGKTTVCEVQKRCADAGLTYDMLREMNNADIMRQLYPKKVSMHAGKAEPD